MNLFLIGHRGSGKTTVLCWLKQKFEGHFFDLDEEIEKRHGSIKKIFAEQGEDHFRKLEVQVFDKLTSSSFQGPRVIALGAGFEGSFPKRSIKIWIRRESDLKGRIFLDRPDLEMGKTPLDQWKLRFSKRQKHYEDIHTDVLTLPEGRGLSDLVLQRFFRRYFRGELSIENWEGNFFSTLLPLDKQKFSKKILYSESRFIELRDDLFSHEELGEIESAVTPERLYFAYRKPMSNAESKGKIKDWDLALGPPQDKFWSISNHGQSEEVFKRFIGTSEILKWSPEVESFKDLLHGHLWWKEDPYQRSFLPRSKSGRWRWYRRLFGPQMPIHFVKDQSGSAPDQPFWYETLLTPLSNNRFAAVLGENVDLSWTPAFHHDFFMKRNMPVVSINVSPAEWEEALPVLKFLGLRAAAVTSPLKKLAYTEVSHFLNEDSKDLGSVNTLVFDSTKTFGVSTDLDGLQYLSDHLKDPVCIWGGGGLLPVLKTVFPQAKSFQARKGGSISAPSTLLWASKRSNDVVFPQDFENIKSIIDMNYFEDSMGKELAKQLGCHYLSGEAFFVSQAEAQQRYWSQLL
ncbi:MAG: hypothetical protein GW917_01350 [Bdellovibrionales bacterium]|nr:hypothetical protein [Bdellovibrionales bacterium]